MSKKPDTIRISLSFNSKAEAYAGSIDNLNEAISGAIALFNQCGVIYEPQTERFSINGKVEGNEYPDNSKSQGYKACYFT